MWCCKCNNHIGRCTCPDIEERMAKIAQSPHVALRICKACGHHADRCTCGDGPSTSLRVQGQEIRVEQRPHKWFRCPDCDAWWRDDSRIYNHCGHNSEPVEIADPTLESTP